MAVATVLAVFVVLGLLDSLHFRPALASRDGQPPAYAVEVLSLLDAVATPLRTRHEKTYSAPFATHAYAKESVETRGDDGGLRMTREFPRLESGGAHLGGDASLVAGDVAKRVFAAEFAAALVFAVVSFAVVGCLARRSGRSLCLTARDIGRGETGFAWKAVLSTLAILLAVALPLVALSADYHVFGTDKVGQDVFYEVLKSVRTALVIGLVLAEAVLSYVGIGVDPTMISFGTMINNARMELAREPMVWWSLAAAFVFMFSLVLAANLLADALRDAFDPRMG